MTTNKTVFVWVKRWWPVLLVIAGAAAIRLFHLGAQSLWSDEALTWSASRLASQQLLVLSEWDLHPPLYYWVLQAFLTVLPDNEAGLRAASVVLSLLGLSVMLWFVADRWGRSAAIYAGLLFAVSSFDVYYAQEARMYTLLAAAGLVSYIGLAQALAGQPRGLIIWAIAAIALPWTQMYGFLTLGAYAVFIGGYLLWGRVHRTERAVSARAFVLAGSIVLLGVAPMVRIFLLHRNETTSAAWVPALPDIRDLYLLCTTGLAATRQNFLDGAHLTLPLTATTTPAVWFAAGSLVVGIPAVIGLVYAWRRNETDRGAVVLALCLIVLPVAGAWGYAVVRNARLWVQRPFLGTAYLLYLWAGVGFSALPWRRVRWVLAPIALLVALTSLLPYFTLWQKSNARQILTTIPEFDEHQMLLLEMHYLASEARFYRGADAPLLAVEIDPQGIPQLKRPVFDGPHPYTKVFGGSQAVNCDDLADVTDLWAYGQPDRIRWMLPLLPGCVMEKTIWLFQQDHWGPLLSFVRDAIDGNGWVYFDDIRDAGWTDEVYRHVDSGDAFFVEVLHAQSAGRHLTIRHFNTPGRVLEIWAGGQLVATVGDGVNGEGWMKDTIELPALSGDTALIIVRNVGPEGAGVTGIGIAP